MILALVLIGISPILIIIVTYIIKDFLSKKQMKFYTDQGVVADFFPVTGAYAKIH